MDEVAQADFRTAAEGEECGGVLPRAEVVRAAFLLVEKEKTAFGKNTTERFVEVQVAESPANLPGESADRSPAAEWPEPDG